MSWIKPPSGVVTCNVDAAVFSSTKQFGFGCVVRDLEGHFCGARSAAVRYPLMEPVLAETLREALSWLKTCSFLLLFLSLIHYWWCKQFIHLLQIGLFLVM